MQQPQQWRRLLKAKIDNADQKVITKCWERQAHLENSLTLDSFLIRKKKKEEGEEEEEEKASNITKTSANNEQKWRNKIVKSPINSFLLF